MKTNTKSEKKRKRTLYPYLAVTILSLFLASCGSASSSGTSNSTSSVSSESATEQPAAAVDTKAHSDSKGVGKFTNVKIDGFSAEIASKGKTVFESKCAACHKTTDQKIVGPGLKGVTERRTPEWVMNMITNPQEMTQKDPIAKALLEEHLTQMTFQSVSDDETRQILEYLRQNDGAK